MDLFPRTEGYQRVTPALRRPLLIIAVAATLAGCVATGTIPPRSDKDDCERWGGVWKPYLSYCERQTDGGPI